jgi:hypothetical protein
MLCAEQLQRYTVYSSNMVYFTYIIVNTLHKGYNSNNNNNNSNSQNSLVLHFLRTQSAARV